MWILSTFGCGFLDLPEDPPTPTALPPLTAEGPAWFAATTQAPRARPRRFDAGLPATGAAWAVDLDAFPPAAALANAVCVDAPGARGRLATRLQTPAASSLGDLAMGCPDLCGWAVDRSAGSPEVAHALHQTLAACEGPEVDAFMRDEASDALLISWLERKSQHETIAVERLVEPIRRALADTPPQVHGLRALVLLGESGSAESGRALYRLHDTVHPANRDQVALAMWGRRDDVVLAPLHRAACLSYDDIRCDWARVDPYVGLHDALSNYEIEPRMLPLAFPDQERIVIEALHHCGVTLVNDDPWQSTACLTTLSQIDRTRGISAVDKARAQSWEPDRLTPLAEGLALGPSGIRDRLRQIGLAEIPATADPVTVIDALVASGAAIPLDTGSGLTSQTAILYRLARLVGLTDVDFDQIDPDLDGTLAGRTPYRTLFAWTEGRRFRTLVDERTVWWGTEYTIGLINTLLSETGASGRLGAVVDRGHLLAVFAPIDVLEPLRDDGLIVFEALPEVHDEVWISDTGL